MASPRYILALDQGTTSSRAVLFDIGGTVVNSANVPLAAHFPDDGWVEQDAEAIWQTQLSALKTATQGIEAKDILSIGITNQRETTVVWDRKSGRALAPAIVWQCRRSAAICDRFRAQGLEDTISRKTGLVLDSYFSASKMLWLLENVDGLRAKAKKGELVFGTVDAWLMYKLTAESQTPLFATEPSNASRTMLYSLEQNDWDDELLALFSLTRDNLPQLFPSAGMFGTTTVLGNPIPITGVAGDQQASLLGHGSVTKDSSKCTFGTGAFMLLNTGQHIQRSTFGLLTSVGWSLPQQAQSAGTAAVTYAVEGSVFVAGALIQWLRDKLGIIKTAASSEDHARRVPDSGGVVIVPAFVGLGAPYWNSQVRGAIFGLTRDTSGDHLVRAALEGVAHQVADLIEAPEFASMRSLSIDGGMSANALFCETLADLSGVTIEASANPELTAVGAARLAAIGSGLFGDVVSAANGFAPKSAVGGALYNPTFSEGTRHEARDRWKKAVSAVQS